MFEMRRRIVLLEDFALDPVEIDFYAIGDAAMAFDPLSSQGIIKGLRQGWKAGQIVSKYLAGETAAIAHFSQDLEAIFSEYVTTRSGYYATEQRWADSLFWRRRHPSVCRC